MPFLHGHAGFGAPGETMRVSSPLLQSEIDGGYWSQYPADWQSGIARQVQPSDAPAASPPGWNRVQLNLGKMLKRMEQMAHPPLSRADALALGLDPYRRTS